jgi:hypothetical protein
LLFVASGPANSHGLKSENKAFHLSLWSTAIPAISSGVWFLLIENYGNTEEMIGSISLGTSALLFSPSVGYFYADKPKMGLRGIAARTGVAVSTVLLSVATGQLNYESVKPNAIIAACGGGILLYSIIHDIIKVRQAVKEYNQDICRKNILTITPAYFPKSTAIGLSIMIPL